MATVRVTLLCKVIRKVLWRGLGGVYRHLKEMRKL